MDIFLRTNVMLVFRTFYDERHLTDDLGKGYQKGAWGEQVSGEEIG